MDGVRRRSGSDGKSARIAAFGSGRVSERPLSGLRDLDGNEKVLWVEVVLPRLINDTNKVPRCSDRISDEPVDLAQFQRSRIPLVAHANGESNVFPFRAIISRKEPFDLHFSLADTVGLIPVHLRLAQQTVVKAYRRDPFDLPPASCPVHAP